jgi:hypothetical protein
MRLVGRRVRRRGYAGRVAIGAGPVVISAVGAQDREVQGGLYRAVAHRISPLYRHGSRSTEQQRYRRTATLSD